MISFKESVVDKVPKSHAINGLLLLEDMHITKIYLKTKDPIENVWFGCTFRNGFSGYSNDEAFQSSD